MDHAQLNWIANFIWNIADDELRGIYARGKYRDVILPMIVLRRLDAVLEPSKDAVLRMKAQLDKAKIADQRTALCQAAGQAFYNTSNFTLRTLRASKNHQNIRADFEAYLDGFSPNVQEILDCFQFRNQVPKMVRANILGPLIEKFLDPEINLSPKAVLDTDGRIRLPGLDNHAMGTVFEELIRRFNEENNEEAGEHFTPRDVVTLMAKLLFLPVAEQIASGTYLLYDGACGTGGMLTVAEEALQSLAAEHGREVSIHLFGQEISPETYAICKADLLLKGEGHEAENIVGGEEMSTLSNDAFRSKEFDFMLSNPPYGKNWKNDLERMGGKDDLNDPRFVVAHGGDPAFKLITRSSDGQLMFLANKLAKMKRDTPLGSRIALVHNGSALFTGDAGQGESNIRRYVLENDWLEAIIALPLNMFYNTGIATYIWVLSNRKAESRRGRVQLIDATTWSRPLRKNLGKKNCQLTDDDITRIMEAYLSGEESIHSKQFVNAAFGYKKITVERPLRLRSQFTTAGVETLRFASGDEVWRRQFYDRHGEEIYLKFAKIRPELEKALMGDTDDEVTSEGDVVPTKKKLPEKRRKKLLDPETWQRDLRLVEAAEALWETLGSEQFDDHNEFRDRFNAAADTQGLRLSAPERKLILRAISWRDETAPPVIAKRVPLATTGRGRKKSTQTLSAAELAEAQIYGRFAVTDALIEYEPDPDLRDTEQVPLLEIGGIETFFLREVRPYASDAWIDAGATRIGYEISFARHFFEPKPLRSLDTIKAEIYALEAETDGLLELAVGTKAA